MENVNEEPIEISDAVRSHILAMNKQERQKLLANIEAAEKAKKESEERKKKSSFSLRSVISGLFPQHSRNDLERFSSSELSEAARAAEKHKETQEDAAMQENIAGDAKTDGCNGDADQSAPSLEDSPKSPSAVEQTPLLQALSACGEDYAIFVYGITPPDMSKEMQIKCLQAGIDILGVPIYQTGEGMYAGVLNDCWNNRNAIERMKQELLQELTRVTMLDFHVVTLGAVKKQELSPAMCLKRSLTRLLAKQTNAKKQEEQEETTDNMQELVTRLRKEIEANAIEQAKRQFEQQMEENGELVPEEPVVIREAANMSPAEYDSFLSEDEQKMKREAKNRYIDDDVSIAQVLHNIEKHRTLDDPLYLIAIASVDMNTLIILEDTEDFESLCRDAGVSMIQCSYIYAISRSGGHWYGNNHATKEIENIFDGLSEMIVQNGGRFRKEYLYSVPNISIFKDIFLQ